MECIDKGSLVLFAAVSCSTGGNLDIGGQDLRTGSINCAGSWMHSQVLSPIATKRLLTGCGHFREGASGDKGATPPGAKGLRVLHLFEADLHRACTLKASLS